MGVTLTMMDDDVGSILGWLQGRRCVPDHPTHCAMLDETHEGRLGVHQGKRTERCVPLPHLHPVEGFMKVALKVILLDGFLKLSPLCSLPLEEA